jgi:hypothetical protein
VSAETLRLANVGGRRLSIWSGDGNDAETVLIGRRWAGNGGGSDVARDDSLLSTGFVGVP